MNHMMQQVASAVTAGKVQNDAPLRKMLTFGVSGEIYALGISKIKEIIEYSGVTRIPMMPDFIRGVINLRGAVVPVVDLALRLGRPGGEVGRRTCIVIVEVTGGDECLDVGVVVDAVNEVLDVADEDVEPAPSFGANIRTDFIAGMARNRGSFIIILHEERVLAVDELSAIQPQ
jgi:purine-binding chemotaxis protein CheW